MFNIIILLYKILLNYKNIQIKSLLKAFILAYLLIFIIEPNLNSYISCLVRIISNNNHNMQLLYNVPYNMHLNIFDNIALKFIT